MSEKVCKRCGETKDISNFNKDSKMKDGYRNQCNSCVNERRQERYSDNIEKMRSQQKVRDSKRNKNPERKEYMKNHAQIEKTCIHCNVSFVGGRYSNKNECDSCIEKQHEQQKQIKTQLKEMSSILRKELAKLNKYNEKIINKEIKLRERTKECITCGKTFIGKSVQVSCCSAKCRKKADNRNKELLKGKRGERIKSNGRIDNDISLDKLIIRDKNICHICGEKCDTTDYVINEYGHFIVGKLYPSIDHILAIANGGTHTWDNVSLAHMICNSIKSDRVVI